MKIGQSIALVVFLTLTSFCGAHPSGFAQQAGPAAAAPQTNAQPLTYTAGPLPPEFVPDPQQFPTVILWPDGAPGSEKYKGEGEDYRMVVSHGYFTSYTPVISQVHAPSLTVFLPPKKIATGAAIIVAPGGGSRELWIDSEGYRAAAWLSRRGIAAFVLKYRLPGATGSTYTMNDELADMQRAIRTVKNRAAEWGVDPNRVGIMGFSAGGVLAGIAGQRFDDPVAKPVDAIDRISAKPAFEALIYGQPFFSSQGTKPLVAGVRKDTPPTFLLCGGEDHLLPRFYPQVYQMLKDAGVPAELHIYEGIGHGFGIQPETSRSINRWADRFYDWLFDSSFLTKPE